MRKIVYALLLIPAVVFGQHQDGESFNSIYAYALRGEMQEVFTVLNGFDNKELSEQQLQRKKDYFDRFLFKNENFDYKTTDEDVKDLYNRFINYWHSVLIEQVELKIADSLFGMEMAHFLKAKDQLEMNPFSIRMNIGTHFKDFLKSRNYYGLIFGKTGHLHDLYLWGKETEKIYEISLPEGTVNVPVVFMEEFVSNGWAHYSTFGHSYSGGWVGKEKLFCVKDAYDIESEGFLVSYVSHEGQHYKDLSQYPNLKQADLEYRAKLCELALAKTSIYKLMNRFDELKKNDKDYAHAYANYLVIKQLSDEFLGEDSEIGSEGLENIPVKSINKYAAKLLKENSKALKKAGSKVESVIL